MLPDVFFFWLQKRMDIVGGFAIVTHSHHHNLFQIHGEFLAQPQKTTCLTGRL
jgi:hypothetical protein